MVPGSLASVPRGVSLEGGSHTQPYKLLPNILAISRLAVHDEILPNWLSSDVSSATEWLEVQ